MFKKKWRVLYRTGCFVNERRFFTKKNADKFYNTVIAAYVEKPTKIKK